MHRLPFGFYLRVDQANQHSRHEAEYESLRLVEKYTDIPAPRPADVLQCTQKSYLVMTRVPGKPIGTVLNYMTDEQVEIARHQLSGYITQLRSIPRPTHFGAAQICNSLGGGILDWRIGDSQNHELKFAAIADFHQALTAKYSKEVQEKAQRAHSKD